MAGKKKQTASSKKSTSSFSFLQWIKRILIILFVSHLLYVILLKWVFPPITLTQLSSLISGEGLSRDYVRLKEIDRDMRIAIVAAEDQLFPDHNGFDWKSIRKAMEYNQRKPGRVRGASTLSQQTAKNVFLWQGRSWFRKGLEVYYTFLIETVWGKQRILEIYLNVAEMGEGIYGVEAAAQAYYGKHAASLSRKEAAQIAACLPNPKKYKVKPVSKYVSSRSRWVIRQMNNLESDPDLLKVIDVKN
jgi:monofunctional biosynthetic peptidoglycan transglycosylase